jgi:lipoprotein-anchoring transpeptidase ErfK/SrfK
MKSYGTNAKGMVHSSYFIRGYAIHGYASVPIYNASHGCLRVPIPEADYIFDWVRLGTIVDTYR